MHCSLPANKYPTTQGVQPWQWRKMPIGVLGHDLLFSCLTIWPEMVLLPCDSCCGAEAVSSKGNFSHSLSEWESAWSCQKRKAGWRVNPFVMMKTTTWTSSSSFHKVKPPFHHPLDIFGLFSFLGIKTKQRLTLKVAFVFILKSTKKKCRTVIIPIHFYTSGLKLSTLLLWRRQAHFLSAILKLTLVAPIDSPAWSFHYREIRWAVGGWVCCPHQERVIIISTWGSEKKQKKPPLLLVTFLVKTDLTLKG